MSVELSFVLTDRLADGRRDGFTIAKTALHTMPVSYTHLTLPTIYSV